MKGSTTFSGLKLALAILTLTAFAAYAGAREVPREMFIDVGELHYMVITNGDAPFPMSGKVPVIDFPMPNYAEREAPFALPMEDYPQPPFIQVDPPFATPTWVGPTDPFREIRPPFHTMDR